MAIPSGASPTVLSYTIRDENGTEASAVAYTNFDGTAETVDGLVGEWLAYGGYLNACTDGQIVNGRITIPCTPSTSWNASPASGSRVEQTAVLNLRTATSTHRQGYIIPAVKNSLIASGKLVVASGALKTLADALFAGFNNGNFSNAAGLALTAWVDAILSFRKRRKQLSRTSYEQTTAD